MLNVEKRDERTNRTIIRSLTNDPIANPMALGCQSCPTFGNCGGLCVAASIFDCLGLCCGSPDGCSRVCRNNPGQFVKQVREIEGFELDSVPRAKNCHLMMSDDVVPQLYHGRRRRQALKNGAFAIRLADIIDYRTGNLRFSDRESLCNAFLIDPNSELILVGVDHDHRIEPWWGLSQRRVPLIRKIRELGVRLVTTPNFSVVLDHPRTDDLHAMKRIAIVWEEFQNQGLACAIHPNGRTERDFLRWAQFIRERSEIQVLAYEFITGPAREERKQFHLDQLARICSSAKRPLDIVVRGDPRVIPFLRNHFRSVVYIETTAFMKTINRQRAERVANDRIQWIPSPTAVGANLDELLEHNLEEQSALLRTLYYSEMERFGDAT